MTATAVVAPEHVAVPEVAVQPGRRFLGQQRGEASYHRVDAGGLGVGQGATVTGQLGVGQHPTGRVELRPRRGAALGQREAGDEAVGLGAVRRRTRGVRVGQPAAEVGRVVAVPAPGLDPGQDQAVRSDREDVGHGHAALDLAQPPQPGGLPLEEALRRARHRLHQGRRAVAQPQLRRRRDVATGDRRGRGDGRTEQRLGTTGQEGLAGHPALTTVRGRRAGRRRSRRSCVRPSPAPPRTR